MINKNELKNNAVKIARNPKTIFVVACVIIIFIIVYVYGRVPTSYLSVDINPSIEMGVNAFGRVVSVNSYNKEGKELIGDVNVEGKSVKEATKLIISRSILEGYISSVKEATILLTVAMNNDKIANKILANANSGANEILIKGTYKTTIYKNVVAMSYYNDANKYGMSIGRYDLYKKAKEKNSAETVTAFKNNNVTDLVTQLKKDNISLDGTVDTTTTATPSTTETGTTSGSRTGTATDGTSSATKPATSGTTTTVKPGTTDATSGATKPVSGGTTTKPSSDDEEDDEDEYEDD
mgnify:CR=1 FL=1